MPPRPDRDLVAAARAHPAYPPQLLERRGSLVVCAKPSGLASTGRHLNDPDCLQALVMGSTKKMAWAVHQLDRETSGVNLFVLKKTWVHTHAEALRQGQKRYLALVEGKWSAGDTTIDAPIARIDGSPQIDDSGRRAVSHVRVLEIGSQASLLEVSIETGRTHQVRLHVAHLGHPVVGDRRYGTPGDRHFLHARQITLGGDIEGSWQAPLPADFCAALNHYEISEPGES